MATEPENPVPNASLSDVVQRVLAQPAYANHIRDLVTRAFAGDEAARSELVSEFALSPSDLMTLGRSPADAVEFNELLARCSNPRTIQTQAALTTFALFSGGAAAAAAAKGRPPAKGRKTPKGGKKNQAKAKAKGRRVTGRPARAKRAAPRRRR
jgi:hypothetical protein